MFYNWVLIAAPSGMYHLYLNDVLPHLAERFTDCHVAGLTPDQVRELERWRIQSNTMFAFLRQIKISTNFRDERMLLAIQEMEENLKMRASHCDALIAELREIRKERLGLVRGPIEDDKVHVRQLFRLFEGEGEVTLSKCEVDFILADSYEDAKSRGVIPSPSHVTEAVIAPNI